MNFLCYTAPEWLVNVWSLYGGKIVPVLVTVMLALLTYVAVKLKADAKLTHTKNELQIKELKRLAEKENCVNDLGTSVEVLDRNVKLLGKMFYVAFDNSQLPTDIKNELNSMYDEMEHGVSNTRVKELESELQLLSDRLESVTKETPVVIENKSESRMR